MAMSSRGVLLHYKVGHKGYLTIVAIDRIEDLHRLKLAAHLQEHLIRVEQIAFAILFGA